MRERLLSPVLIFHLGPYHFLFRGKKILLSSLFSSISLEISLFLSQKIQISFLYSQQWINFPLTPRKSKYVAKSKQKFESIFNHYWSTLIGFHLYEYKNGLLHMNIQANSLEHLWNRDRERMQQYISCQYKNLKLALWLLRVSNNSLFVLVWAHNLLYSRKCYCCYFLHDLWTHSWGIMLPTLSNKLFSIIFKGRLYFKSYDLRVISNYSTFYKFKLNSTVRKIFNLIHKPNTYDAFFSLCAVIYDVVNRKYSNEMTPSDLEWNN